MTTNRKNSIRPNPSGDWPQVHPTAYVDPTALIIGNVHIGPNVLVGPNAVLRADEADSSGEVQPIKIGAQCNVQDGVIIHAFGGTKVTVGDRTSLSHGCVIHGPCAIGQNCFVGFRAVAYNVTLEDTVLIGAGAVVHGVNLVANSLVPAAAAILSEKDALKLVNTTSLVDLEFMKKIVNANITLAQGYLGIEKQKQQRFAK
ncbi:MAG: DapH/DapD/GlmU-related protein [Phycisphaerae bacterium]|nr:DapH/DapD/GlmU-related protein [Phycisphaerae bacterium]